MNHYLFIVEGAHDVALLSSILRLLDYKNVKNFNEIVYPLDNLIMDKFPIEKNNLEVYNNMPSFFYKDNKNLCIVTANGETKLIKTLDNCISKFRLDELDYINKVVIFCDGDLKGRDQKIHDLIKWSFPKDHNLEISKKRLEKGFVSLTNMEFIKIPLSFFVMPNNKDSGRLEEILLQAIEHTDGELLDEVDLFLSRIPDEYKKRWGDENSKCDKTRIACTGNVKAPGSSMSVLITSGRWITSETIESCESLNCIYRYIKNTLA
ncbi:hypothetical protein CHL78_016630 [Romboutsia weinsteinii]|uniref:DUF4276 family protein n=1 Tax=Romboutsia weinsteinii TaxID=2020949 RepID=A0A371IZ51_9FIRM|nr:DUF3226 domain-containing protein [Romboutsia weinsteinii]RDY25761.1 hypothetical protein CHL78_016630 [Romboutsia weinsteinii]